MLDEPQGGAVVQCGSGRKREREKIKIFLPPPIIHLTKHIPLLAFAMQSKNNWVEF